MNATRYVAQSSFFETREQKAGAERSFDSRARNVRTRWATCKSGNVQALAQSPVPIVGIRGMLERNAAIGKILRKTAPGGEVQFGGFLELREVAVEPRTFGEQLENAVLGQHVDLVLPDHVVNGRKPVAVADQDRRQACQPVPHDDACQGTGIASANPALYTGCAKPSGATSGAMPCTGRSASTTDPSEIMFRDFFRSPERSGLSTRPARDTSA